MSSPTLEGSIKKISTITLSSGENDMLKLKHVEYEISDIDQLEALLDHLDETTSQVDDISLKDIYFVKGKKEFVLFLECENEEVYHK